MDDALDAKAVMEREWRRRRRKGSTDAGMRARLRGPAKGKVGGQKT